MTISALPEAPNKLTDTPQQFAEKADALLSALVDDFVGEANALASDVNDDAAAAATSAASAVAAPGTSATSTTSLAIGTGSKSLTIQTGKDLVVGMKVLLAVTASPTTCMYGTITAYNSGTGALTVSVEYVYGSGTYDAWTVSLTGPRHAAGFGIGQSWTTVTGSRVKGSNYTNDTGLPILVAVVLYYGDDSGDVYLYIDGTVTCRETISYYGEHRTLSAVVPNGSVYSVAAANSLVLSWRELR